MPVYFLLLIFFTVDRKFSQTKTFSQNMIYMFCLYHFSLKCIIKNFYLFSDDPLNPDRKHGLQKMSESHPLYIAPPQCPCN